MALFPEDVAAMNQMRARVPDFGEGLSQLMQALQRRREEQRMNAPLAGPQQNLADQLQSALGVKGTYQPGTQGPPLMRAPPSMEGSRLGEYDMPEREMGPQTVGQASEAPGGGRGPQLGMQMAPEPIQGAQGKYSLPQFTNRQWAESGDTLKMLAGLKGREMGLEGTKYRADASRHVAESRNAYQMIREGRVADKAARETAMQMWKNGQSQIMALGSARDRLLANKASMMTDQSQINEFVTRMDEITNQIREVEDHNKRWSDLLEEYATGQRTDPTRSTGVVSGSFNKATGEKGIITPEFVGGRGGNGYGSYPDEEPGLVKIPFTAKDGSQGVYVIRPGDASHPLYSAPSEPSYTGRGKANGMKTPVTPTTKHQAGGSEAAADQRPPGSVNSTGKTSEGGARTNSGGAHPIDTTVAFKEPQADRPEVQDALARSRKSGVFGAQTAPKTQAPPPVQGVDQQAFNWAKGMTKEQRAQELQRRIMVLREMERKRLMGGGR